MNMRNFDSMTQFSGSGHSCDPTETELFDATEIELVFFLKSDY